MNHKIKEMKGDTRTTTPNVRTAKHAVFEINLTFITDLALIVVHSIYKRATSVGLSSNLYCVYAQA